MFLTVKAFAKEWRFAMKDVFRWLRREEQISVSDRTPKISEHVVWRKLGRKELFVVALNLKSGIFHILEDVEARIWLLTDREKTIERIIDTLHEEFPRIRKKRVIKIIENFRKNELIELT